MISLQPYFENFGKRIVTDLIKQRWNQGKDAHLFFFRDAHGHEVDLIFRSGNDLVPIEIKPSMTFNKDFLKNVNCFRKVAEERCHKGYIHLHRKG